jgi:hypothetical protein
MRVNAHRILESFADPQSHHLVDSGMVLELFDPELTTLQRQVLGLLHVPHSVYVSKGVR